MIYPDETRTENTEITKIILKSNYFLPRNN